MTDSIKEPRPFLPHWRVKIGPLVLDGDGLLLPALSPQRGLVDVFTVFLGSWQITVKPQLGQVWADSRLVVQRKPARLFWCRRMAQEIGTHDRNTAAARCLYYMVGLEGPEGCAGFRIFEDGTARLSERL